MLSRKDTIFKINLFKEEGLLKIVIFIFLILPSLFEASVNLSYPNRMSIKSPKLRVLLKRSLLETHIQGIDLIKITRNGKKKQFLGKQSLLFNCKKPLVKKSKKSLLVASLSSNAGLLMVNDNMYQGKIEILANFHKGGCDLVQEVDLESYLKNLLAKEMNASWHIEALKAQAVAARSYAMNRMIHKQVFSEGNDFFHLENSEKDQVGGSFFDATTKTSKAVDQTRGEILVADKNKIVPVFYHAQCGGETLLPEDVWGGHVDGYSRVKCPFCLNSNRREWKEDIKYNSFIKFLNWAKTKEYINFQGVVSQKSLLRIMQRAKLKDGIVVYIDDVPVEITNNHLRRYFGRTHFPSNNFSLKMSKNKIITVIGHGHGHGVGLCQVGAQRAAKKNMKYREILAHYFPKLKLKKMY